MTPAGGAVPLVNLFLGEVIFGGVGSGLYGMFFYILIAVFIAGLMVGRTPEWLGKKIEAREIKIAALGALFVPTMVLTMAAVAIVTKSGLASVFNHGVHGFTETLYAYDSQANNNGSAFAGYGATSFSATFGTVAMYFGRFVPLLAALALGGSLAAEEDRARVGRDVPHRRADVRRAARRRDRAHGRSHDPARADARADRRRADALMRNLVSSVLVVVVCHRRVRLRLPGADDRLRLGCVPAPGDGQPDPPQREGRRLQLAAQSFTWPRYFHERPSGTAPAYNAGGTTFANLGPTSPDLAKLVAQNAQAILKLERPVQPGPDDPRHPRRRRDDVGLRDRSRHLAGVRRAAGAPRAAAVGTCRSRPCSS